MSLGTAQKSRIVSWIYYYISVQSFVAELLYKVFCLVYSVYPVYLFQFQCEKEHFAHLACLPPHSQAGSPTRLHTVTSVEGHSF